VTEKVKITNLLEPTLSVEVEAVVDTGAVMLVLPQDTVDKLKLRVMVRYANNATETKSVYGVVTIEINGRIGNFDVLAENAGSQPLKWRHLKHSRDYCDCGPASGVTPKASPSSRLNKAPPDGDAANT
jgi:predicted aspartyl protease